MSVEQISRELAVVVLAAGKGTRMKSEVPKVIHAVLGRTVLGWVLAAAGPLGAARTIVVVGHGADQVRATIGDQVETVVQQHQRGSGDALAAALPALDGFDGDVLVVNGDGALFTSDTLATVASRHAAEQSHATALAIRGSVQLPYGRVLRGPDDTIDRIVEASEATPEELTIDELNAGVYCFNARALRDALPQLDADNVKGEYYITDLLELIGATGARTLAVVAGSADELLGINTRADLADVETVLRRRIVRELMQSGVTVSMPDTVLIEPTVQIEPDATILAGTMLRGATRVAAGAIVGPYAELTDTVVESAARVDRSVCVGGHIGQHAQVGPFAYVRPGTVMREASKLGTFAELKNTDLGPRSKVPHLSYIGDATVGSDSNIGAGNITANYRPELGRGKQRSQIGSRVRTGSDCVLVAPVSIGDDAFTGAGSIIVSDVPAGALAIARARQTNIENYSERVTAAAPPSV